VENAVDAVLHRRRRRERDVETTSHHWLRCYKVGEPTLVILAMLHRGSSVSQGRVQWRWQEATNLSQVCRHGKCQMVLMQVWDPCSRLRDMCRMVLMQDRGPCLCLRRDVLSSRCQRNRMMQEKQENFRGRCTASSARERTYSRVVSRRVEIEMIRWQRRLKEVQERGPGGW